MVSKSMPMYLILLPPHAVLISISWIHPLNRMWLICNSQKIITSLTNLIILNAKGSKMIVVKQDHTIKGLLLLLVIFLMDQLKKHFKILSKLILLPMLYRVNKGHKFNLLLLNKKLCFHLTKWAMKLLIVLWYNSEPWISVQIQKCKITTSK